MATKKLITSFVIHSIVTMVLTSPQGVSGFWNDGEIQTACKPYPNTKKFAEALPFGIICAAYLLNMGDEITCASDRHELACQAAYSLEKKIKVCDGTEMILWDGNPLTIQTGIAEDKTIECDGCHCTMGRITKKKSKRGRFFSKRYICPYFTTNNLDSKLNLKGFKFRNYEYKERSGSFQELNETPEQNIIAMSNIRSIFNPMDPIDQESHDIKIKSELKETKNCSPKSSKKSKDGAKMYDSATAEWNNNGDRRLLQKKTEQKRRKEGIKGLRPQAKPVKRQLQENITSDVGPFCNDDFFEEDTEEMTPADGTTEDAVETTSSTASHNALYHLCITLASNPDEAENIKITLEDFPIFQEEEEEDSNDKIIEDLIFNAGLADNMTTAADQDFDDSAEGDVITELSDQFGDEYKAKLWEAFAGEIGTNDNGEITSHQLDAMCSSLFNNM